MALIDIMSIPLKSSLKKCLCTFFFIFILSIIKKEVNSQNAENNINKDKLDSKQYEEKLFLKLNKTNHEQNAINLLNECIYKGIKFSNDNILNYLTNKGWMKATKLVTDFLLNLEDKSTLENTKTIITKFIEESQTHLDSIKSLLYSKKKNIIRISPIFEWSQDSEYIKIRLKFAKNLESPGEKEIQNFKMNCTRTHLTIRGYKEKEDYLTYYYRQLHLYDFIKTYSCEGYKETDGSFVVKFLKNQPTLYWNFLNQINDDHYNTFTWFDVFTAYDDKARFTSYREWVTENLYMNDVDEYIKEKSDEKIRRLNKIKSTLNFLKTKDYENKNFCNSPINENYCILSDIHDWNYWLF